MAWPLELMSTLRISEASNDSDEIRKAGVDFSKACHHLQLGCAVSVKQLFCARALHAHWLFVMAPGLVLWPAGTWAPPIAPAPVRYCFRHLFVLFVLGIFQQMTLACSMMSCDEMADTASYLFWQLSPGLPRPCRMLLERCLSKFGDGGHNVMPQTGTAYT